MITEYTNRGVCSQKTVVELDADKKIKRIEIIGGCNGNTKGLSALLVGMDAHEAIARMRGIRCGGRPTSCPDQVANALEKALSEANA